MSATALARDAAVHPHVATHDRSVRVAQAIAGVGATLVVVALVLVVLRARAEVPAGGDRRVAITLVRVLAATLLLPVGALLVAHVPRHPLGPILCAAGLGSVLAAVASEYATSSHVVAPLPAGQWIGWLSEWVSAPIILIPAVSLLLFPTGRVPSARWRPALWCGLAATGLVALSGILGPGEDLAFQGNPFLGEATATSLGDPLSAGWLLMAPATAAGIAAIVLRARSAAGAEREQLRLLARAGGLVAVAFLACLAGSLLSPSAGDAGGYAAIGSLAVLATTMGAAILRHRLLGVDVHVNRALVLTSLTLVLSGLYVGVILAVGELLGRHADLEIALPATVVVAVAVLPARDRLQRAVDRLLHGQRDEPYAAIATLGRRLGEAMPPAQVLPVMVETIADALRLPYVAVRLTGDSGPPAAVHGVPAAGVALRLPLVHAGEAVGVLLIGARAHGEALGDADRRLLEDFARRASAAASAVTLSVEVQRSRERLVTAREEERRRLRGDLHDGLGPTLAGAVLTIDAARRVLQTDPAAADAMLDRVAASVGETVDEVRRLVYGLRPPALDELGLAGALRRLASTVGDADGALACEVVVPDPMPDLPAAVEVAAFRITQEALTNVARHAGATRAVVSVVIGEALVLEVRDDGRGLPQRLVPGVGFASMRERATELGGTVEVTSSSPGGTAVHVRLPLPV